MEKTTLYLSKELQLELRAAAEREDRPQAELVRDALTKYLAERPRPASRSIGCVDGPADGRTPASIKKSLRAEWGKKLDRRSKGRGRRVNA